MDQTSMSTIDPDVLLPICGAVNGDPPPPPPPSNPFVQQPLMAPQTQDVGPVQLGPPHRQAACNRQGQNQPILQHVLIAAPTGDPAAPPQPCNAAAAQQIQNLPLLGYLPDGTALYLLPAPTTVKIEPTTVKIEPTTVKIEPTTVKIEPTPVKTKKRKLVKQLHDGPYIKKPPNAFLLFMKERRPNYAAEMKGSGSAVVNGLLGQEWKSLSEHERAKYFEQADVEKRRHAGRHPDWSPGNNYGVKKKRDRSKAGRALAKLMEAASTSEDVPQQDQKPCVCPAVEAPPTNARSPQAVPSQRPDTEVSVTTYDDVESFWLDFNELVEVKELNLTVKMTHDKPAPPEREALASPARADNKVEDELLEWTRAVEALLAVLEESDPGVGCFRL